MGYSVIEMTRAARSGFEREVRQSREKAYIGSITAE